MRETVMDTRFKVVEVISLRESLDGGENWPDPVEHRVFCLSSCPVSPSVIEAMAIGSLCAVLRCTKKTLGGLLNRVLSFFWVWAL